MNIRQIVPCTCNLPQIESLRVVRNKQLTRTKQVLLLYPPTGDLWFCRLSSWPPICWTHSRTARFRRNGSNELLKLSAIVLSSQLTCSALKSYSAGAQLRRLPNLAKLLCCRRFPYRISKWTVYSYDQWPLTRCHVLNFVVSTPIWKFRSASDRPFFVRIAKKRIESETFADDTGPIKTGCRCSQTSRKRCIFRDFEDSFDGQRTLFPTPVGTSNSVENGQPLENTRKPLTSCWEQDAHPRRIYHTNLVQIEGKAAQTRRWRCHSLLHNYLAQRIETYFNLSHFCGTKYEIDAFGDRFIETESNLSWNIADNRVISSEVCVYSILYNMRSHLYNR